MIAKVSRRTNATPTDNNAIAGVVQKEGFEVTIPGFDSKEITFIGLMGFERFFGVPNDPASNIDALAPFTVYLAFKGKPNLQLEDFEQKKITVKYAVDTTLVEGIEHSFTQEFANIVPAPIIEGVDWYCYKLSNTATTNLSDSPLALLQSTDNRIYTGSIKQRLQTIFDHADVKEESYNVEGLAGDVTTRDRQTITLQTGQSYWQVIQQLMCDFGFSCYIDASGVLTFIDSIQALPEAEQSLTTSTGAKADNFNQAVIHNIKETDQRRAVAITVQGFDPNNPAQIIRGTSGTQGQAYNYFTAATNNNQADQDALTLLNAHSWSQHYLTGTTEATPPQLGKRYNISWQTVGNNAVIRNATVVPIKIEYAVSTFSEQNVLNDQQLQSWTGLEPAQRVFNVTLLIVDDGALPCALPTNVNESTILHALTVSNNGETKGDTATDGNQLAIRLPMENCQPNKGTTIYAYVYKPLAMASAIPPAGTPGMIEIDALGYPYFVQAVQQEKLSTDTVIRQSEAATGKDQAEISISTKTDIKLQSSSKTHITINDGSITTTADQTTITVNGSAVDTKTLQYTTTASKTFDVTTNGKFGVEANMIQMNSAVPAIINEFCA